MTYDYKASEANATRRPDKFKRLMASAQRPGINIHDVAECSREQMKTPGGEMATKHTKATRLLQNQLECTGSGPTHSS